MASSEAYIADYGYDVVDAVVLEARVQNTWVPLFAGAIENDAAFIITFPVVDADAFRFRFHYLTSGYYFWLYDFRAYSQPAQVVLPQVVTSAASAVSNSSAVLHGQVTSDGGAPCEVAFQYRATTESAYVTTGWTTGVTTGQGASSVLLPIVGLQSGLSYVYHVVVHSSAGTVMGSDMTFTPKPIVPGSVEWLPGIDVHSESTSEMSWSNATSAIDDDRTTAATCYHPLWTGQWSPYLNVSLPPVAIDHVRISVGLNPYIDAIAVDIQQADGSWTLVYQGAFADHDWQVYTLAATVVYPQARVRVHTTTTAVGTALSVYEVQVRMPPPVTPPVISANDRMSLMQRTTAFDEVAWSNDPSYRASYLAAVDPSRVWQAHVPGAGFVPLMQVAAVRDSAANKIRLAVHGVPNAPVTFVSLENSLFDSNQRASITASTDGNGDLAVDVMVVGKHVEILAASPMMAGRGRWSINRE